MNQNRSPVSGHLNTPKPPLWRHLSRANADLPPHSDNRLVSCIVCDSDFDNNSYLVTTEQFCKRQPIWAYATATRRKRCHGDW
jgi:hypothetical protein